MSHARPGVLSLQAVGRGRRGPRLLDHDGSGADAGSVRGLREAWERLRETAAEFGEQRIYASHNSIMFSRKSCYFFVRPKKSFLEVCVFLGRTVSRRSPRAMRRRARRSRTCSIRHRDEVEAPITDWLHEAYQQSDAPLLKARKAAASKRRKAPLAKRSPARAGKR